MRILGLDITVMRAPAALTPVPSNGGWWPWIRESSIGAWQRNVEIESPGNIFAFSAVYACISLIAGDIAKMPIEVKRKNGDGTWKVDASEEAAVLRKPNSFQTRQQFISEWISRVLLYGNCYVLKEYESPGQVSAMYVLDNHRVTPLVAPDGGIYYRLAKDNLSRIDEETVFPATAVIHDRLVCPYHPILGVSPITACGISATQGLRIQGNSASFFANMSRPSGILTAPGAISEETATRVKAYWESAYVGAGLGKLAVLGDGLKYEAMTIAAHDAQLIEQLRWTVEDVARVFHVPLHMINAGPAPTYSNAEILTLNYYTQTLQTLVEAIESLLDVGLGLAINRRTEFDLDSLLRMDAISRADFNERGIRAGWLAPNEARARENLPAVEGGDTPYLQQQNWSLAQLNQRKPPNDAPAL